MQEQHTTDGAAGLPLANNRLAARPFVPKAVDTAYVVGPAGQLSAVSVQQAQQQVACSSAGDAGSYVAAAAEGRRRGAALWPQKIRVEREDVLASDQVDGGNHEAIMSTDRPMIGTQVSDPLGSSVHPNIAANDMVLALIFLNDILNDNEVCNTMFTSKFVSNGNDTYDTCITLTSEMVDLLDQPKDGTRRMVNKEEVDTIGFHGRVGTASPIKANGNSSVSLLDSIHNTVPTLSLSLIESSPISPVQPTLDDIIAFGGIPKSSIEVRSFLIGKHAKCGHALDGEG
jgi:hypothetical protein